MLVWMTNADFSADDRKAIRENNMLVTIQDFPERLDKHLSAIHELMANIADDDLLNKEVEMTWKEKMALGAGILNAPIKLLTNYSMQLFLNLKLNGRPELGTKEAWVFSVICD